MKNKDKLQTTPNNKQSQATAYDKQRQMTNNYEMIILSNRSLANDHLEGPASYKKSSGWTGFLQMIIWMDPPLQMILLFLLHSSPPQKTYFPFPNISSFSFTINLLLRKKNIFSFSTYIPHFPSPFYFSSAKKSFSKYNPFFPSLSISSSKDPKLKILDS